MLVTWTEVDRVDMVEGTKQSTAMWIDKYDWLSTRVYRLDVRVDGRWDVPIGARLG